MSETASTPMARRGLRTLVVLVVVGALVGLAAGLVARPVYTAVTKTFVSSTGSRATLLADQGPYVQQVARSFAEVVTRPVVLEPVIAELGLGASPSALAKRVDARVAQDSVVLEIAVADPSPTRAAAIANALAQQLVRVADRLMPTGADRDGPERVTIVDAASPPSAPSSPNPALDVALGALIGAAVWLLVAAVRTLAAGARRGSSDGPAAPSML
ncbi:Wzz/FepE/Etk N-terminal domain-containing protein [Amnibacterium setariae]|uniref:Polysaccharide chain length determinant N-terminal domain-containing protein n=1 Tax=Amnibacterium setariae TaxID=2306585 RepID=A0A3A1U037_9MICO|nr:Wzz/FepE/Etk N-terminal domain-containing protein [Amnibacterium setariae]RIX30254.1 hypothetical protein D1781_02090 [Amnibacterium setariae]